MDTNNFKNPRLILDRTEIKEGSVAWRSPSNLAIVKYWGKHGVQLPRNPSISFTLDKAYTETSLYYSPKAAGSREGIAMQFYFEDQPNPAFEGKVRRYLESLLEVFPFLRQLELVIRSRNSFPHSSGIASSASSMSALALCLCSLEQRFFGTLNQEEALKQKASYLARLGSGSACRSVYPGLAVWGETGEVEGASDLFAVPFAERTHPVFLSFHDDILIVSKGEKSVSSRAGHELMDENVYSGSRYQQARRRFQDLITALEMGDVERFGQIAEAEALTLHALMMTTEQPYLLMKPNTVALIDRVQTFRKERNIPLYFSLDAGPNLHLLYPDREAAEIKAFIQKELLPFCENNQYIADGVGKGPSEL